MHHFRIFVIIALLFSLGSCSVHRSFSKRKHLPGKFWNSSGSKRSSNRTKVPAVLKANDFLKNRETVLVEELKDAAHTAVLDTLKPVSASRMEPLGNDHNTLISIPQDERNLHFLEEEAEASISNVVPESNHQLKKPNFFRALAFVLIGALVLGILFTIGGITCVTLAFLYGISNYGWLLILGIIFSAIGAFLLYFVLT
ncbi:MAG: hypothetical protein AB8B56_16820 [Crocinitomicaceae bacterium]